jgi:hypothetical protein
MRPCLLTLREAPAPYRRWPVYARPRNPAASPALRSSASSARSHGRDPRLGDEIQSAEEEYLSHVIADADVATGTIVECGSGLPTLPFAGIAGRLLQCRALGPHSRTVTTI